MMAARAPVAFRRPAAFRLGVAWILMCAALAIHVSDEALTGFLAVYNPTVVGLRARLGSWPMPPFEFRQWLTGLVLGISLLAALSPLAFRNRMRPLMYFTAVVFGLMNAAGHTLATILGHTLPDVRFPRPAPGFYSSPLLFAASIYLLLQLRQTRNSIGQHPSTGAG